MFERVGGGCDDKFANRKGRSLLDDQHRQTGLALAQVRAGLGRNLSAIDDHQRVEQRNDPAGQSLRVGRCCSHRVTHRAQRSGRQRARRGRSELRDLQRDRFALGRRHVVHAIGPTHQRHRPLGQSRNRRIGFVNLCVSQLHCAYGDGRLGCGVFGDGGLAENQSCDHCTKNPVSSFYYFTIHTSLPCP